MPVTYDKQRKQWIARLTYNGKRIFVGRYDSETKANVELKAAERRLKSLDNISVEKPGKYAPQYEQTDRSLIHSWWDKFQARRAERANDKAVEAQLEQL